MVEYPFIRHTAQYHKGTVIFQESDDVERVQIASDWCKGEKLAVSKEPHWSTGFIGVGYTKTGIYVSSSVISVV